MTNDELADRVLGWSWDISFSAPDGLRIDAACANAIGDGRPAHAMGLVRSLLRGDERERAILASMVRGDIERSAIDRLIEIRGGEPPFPGSAP